MCIYQCHSGGVISVVLVSSAYQCDVSAGHSHVSSACQCGVSLSVCQCHCGGVIIVMFLSVSQQ